MKKFFAFLAFAMFSMVFFNYAWAQTKIPVGTGSSTGSYFKFMDQASKVCPDYGITVQESGGSTYNLDAMEANEVSLAISQFDVLKLYELSGRDMSNIKLLSPLFPEQVHFVTRNDVTTRSGQKEIAGFKVPGTGNDVSLTTVLDLKDKRVGAAGGSYKTGQVINQLTALGMNLQDMGGADKGIAALMAGQLEAVILVGAQPLETITKLGPNQNKLRLLPIPDAMLSKLSTVYQKAASPLSYRGMGPGGENIQTVQVQAVLVTQNYGKTAIGDKIWGFRECLMTNAPEQAAVPGTHPAWRNLKLSTQLSWPAWQYDPTSGRPAPGKKK